MGKIVALQKEHGLTFPEEFHFKRGKFGDVVELLE